MSLLVLIKGDSAHTAYIFTAVGDTAAARLSYIIAADRTFVTGNINDLDDIGVCRVAAHSYLYTF